MSYTVVWQPTAENQLAELWAEADDRAAFSRAADHIDAVLADRPNGVGESGPGTAASSSNRRSPSSTK